MPTTTRKPTRAQVSEATRARLLHFARAAFASHGYAATSMDEFTAQAGLTRGALYHHFGGKEGLLAAVVEQIDAELEQRLQAAGEAAPTRWDALQARCRGYLDAAREPEIRRVVLQDARAVLGDVSAAAQLRSIGRLRDALRQLMEDGIVTSADSEALARMLYGAVTEAAFWIAEPDCDYAQRLACALATLDVLLHGLRRSPSPSR